MFHIKRGQSTTEYLILSVIVIAALITMQVYMKRGMQGSWKDSVEKLGDQYDPGKTNAVITHKILSETSTRIETIRDLSNAADPGFWTIRHDKSVTQETKNGTTQVGY